MKEIRLLVILLLLLTNSAISLQGQGPMETKTKLNEYLFKYSFPGSQVGKLSVREFIVNKNDKSIQIDFSPNLAYIPFTVEIYTAFITDIKNQLPGEWKTFTLLLTADKVKIKDLIPYYYRADARSPKPSKESQPDLVTHLSCPYEIKEGLAHRHIALWQSHGLFYQQEQQRWMFQRAKLFQTVEDLFTQSFVLPYLVPMLEKAGANVLIPRERDFSTTEIIIDNKSVPAASKHYIEEGEWSSGGFSGFAHPQPFYRDGENPFTMGDYRQASAILSNKATWVAQIPQKGEYAVYAAYKSVANSTSQALYTIYHSGDSTRLAVNQKMGGGTWIYLGSYAMDKGQFVKITLSGAHLNSGEIITADAFKIGGGMGNIARSPQQKKTEGHSIYAAEDTIRYSPQTSGMPRYVEGARYFLQWAGIPYDIYSSNKGTHDYKDDFQSRGKWVNYLMSESTAVTSEEIEKFKKENKKGEKPHKGLRIPIDMALAFHSDAGVTRAGDTIIGTLAIHTAPKGEKYPSGIPKTISRDLSQLVLDQLSNDIKTLYDSTWNNRGIWNKGYAECSYPAVPSMILELLSHQNFADMRYGLDPSFRFTVGRSIYKGILRFLSTLYHKPYTVQPLPITHFRVEQIKDSVVRLTWRPQTDPLEPSATPTGYRLYTSKDQKGFDNGYMTTDTTLVLTLQPNTLYRFRIGAVNKGGEGFASQTLSAGYHPKSRSTAMIINGFNRLSAPYWFDYPNDSVAGFVCSRESGVADKKDYSFIGEQYLFDKTVPWTHDDAPGFGACYSDAVGKIPAGNTFDYPSIHGSALFKAGCSFVSSSAEAVSEGRIDLGSYPMVDLILGKEKKTIVGKESNPVRFEAFPPPLVKQLTSYCSKGGSLMLSGSYIGEELQDNNLRKLLKFKLRTDRAVKTGKFKGTYPSWGFKAKGIFATTMNETIYAVEAPESLIPDGKGGQTIFRYEESGQSAAVGYKNGQYKSIVFGFPFETIFCEQERDLIMKQIIQFFNL